VSPESPAFDATARHVARTDDHVVAIVERAEKVGQIVGIV
jgi:hypothetical protein